MEENGLTTMMVTHNMKDAIVHGNRLIMMYDGRIVIDVSGEEKKSSPFPDLLALFSSAYECTWNERALCVNLGGTAGWFQVLSQIWGRAFLIPLIGPGKEYGDMKHNTRRWRGLCCNINSLNGPLSNILYQRLENLL